MTFAFDIGGLRSQGFAGFESIASVRATRCVAAPTEPGVYVVIRHGLDDPTWLTTSAGGWFKKKDPTVPVDTLRSNWIDGANVLYIGKADVLPRRLRQYLDFGSGKPVGHWGGRLIWQAEGSEDFLVAWVVDDQPLSREAALIQAFVDQYGAMPFANLRR